MYGGLSVKKNYYKGFEVWKKDIDTWGGTEVLVTTCPFFRSARHFGFIKVTLQHAFQFHLLPFTFFVVCLAHQFKYTVWMSVLREFS